MAGERRITQRMRVMGPVRILGIALLIWWLLLGSPPAMAVEGIFQGKVIDPPVDERVPAGWIFVQGRNHLLRRVEVAHAVIIFGQQVPPNKRRKCGMECLEVGQEIRVTAEQDGSGEWRARRVEILRLTTRKNLMTAEAQFLCPSPTDLYTFNYARSSWTRNLPLQPSFTKLNPILSGAAG